MPTRLLISESGPNCVALSGEIDAGSAPDLSSRLDGLLAADNDIRVDLADVTFIDSSGLRVLIELQRRASAAERRLLLRAPSKSVTRLLEVTGLAGHFDVET